MTDEPGLPLSPRTHFYALLDQAIACESPCIHAPAAYTGLDRDVIEYVETNRTVANSLWCICEADRVVISDFEGPVLTIVRAARLAA